MNEPDNLTLVMLGSLADNDPWDVAVYARDDANADGSTSRWFLTGSGDEARDGKRVSWRWLTEDSRRPLTVLAPTELPPTPDAARVGWHTDGCTCLVSDGAVLNVDARCNVP